VVVALGAAAFWSVVLGVVALGDAGVVPEVVEDVL